MLSGMLILTLQATDVKAANPVVLPLSYPQKYLFSCCPPILNFA